MSSSTAPDIKSGRLKKSELAANFVDLHPPLSNHEALVESDRCYFCYDAPCMKACPTTIDIPLFIREIQAGHPKSAAKTIFNQNILGGMCARVCPTETLCEEACVREHAEGKPVKIGLLQRYATDHAMNDKHPFTRAKATGKKVAVIGAGPAGLACAHRLAMHGHEVTIFESRKKSGGLNEYGIAAYKTVDNFAQIEVDFILEIGGIKIENGKALGKALKLAQLEQDYDAVFLGMGLVGVNALGLKHEETEGVEDAVAYIADLRSAKDLSKLKVGRSVVVIGGGMTAIDIAIQSKLLGAEDVTILYRRGQEHMKASRFEQELAQTHGVNIRPWAAPKKLLIKAGRVIGLKVEETAIKSKKLVGTGTTFEIHADVIFKAIGQNFVDITSGALALDDGRIKVDQHKRTSRPKVWAGGDCASDNQGLTVAAVDDGRKAAENIHSILTGANHG
jgi:dihydropyrimidine dehydrogenase (NAD+) subunit PreT